MNRKCDGPLSNFAAFNYNLRHYAKGKNFMIQLDKEIDFSETFCLFCTTWLPNPHYSPEMSAKVGSRGGAALPSVSTAVDPALAFNA